MLDTLDKINSKLKKDGNLISSIDELPSGFEFDRVVSTGSLTLDRLLCTGGIPMGSRVHIHAQPSNGKSTLAVSIAKNFLEKGLPVLYIDIEDTMRNTGQWFFRKNSLPKELYKNFIIATPRSYSELTGVLYSYIKDVKIPLVIIDTIAAISQINPEDESIKDLGKTAPLGQQARSVSELLRTISAFKSKDTTIIYLNQERDNIVTHGNPMYAPKFKTPGGQAVKFYSDIIIRLHKAGKTIYTQQENGNAMEVYASLEKTKYFDRNKDKSTSMFFLRDGSDKNALGLDQEYDLFEVGSDIGVITRSASWASWNASDGTEYKGQGFHKFMQKLYENQAHLVELYTQIRSTVMETLKKEAE